MELQLNILVFAISLVILRSCVALPVESRSLDQKESQIKLLLQQLKDAEQQRENEKELKQTTPMPDDELMAPVKRNCQFGLANDCGAAHAAYMNGMRNFLSSKRQFRYPAYSSAADQLALKTVGETNDKLSSDRLAYEENSAIKQRLLSYLEAMERKQEDEREENEIMCLALTGLPCGQIWQK